MSEEEAGEAAALYECRPGAATRKLPGTQATLIDLLEFEAEEDNLAAVEDVREVCNYVDAIKYARGQLKSAKGLPLSLRLLN